MKNTRYLIIGAGLAGSTCAYLLKRAGHEVLLLERLDLARKSKLCAGLCTPRAIEMLHLIYGFEADHLFKQHLTSVRCIADEITAMVGNITTKSVERRELDAFAVAKYEALGGEVIDRFSLRSIDPVNKVLTGFVDHERALECSYDVLIAADGALSTTRQLLTGKAPDAILTLEADVEHRGAPYTMAYESSFFGYSWYAPAGERAKIGCGAFRGAPDLKAELDKFARFIGVEVDKVRGAYIPTGSDVLLHTGSCYFLGDAASLICPPSGEGIYFALWSAWCLFRALTTSASYEALLAKTCAVIRREYKTRDVFFNKKFMELGIMAADATPYGRERAVKYALKHFASFE